MSSPAGMPNSFGQWPTPGSQGSPVPTNNDCEEEGVEVRPMRLKVLYTFDDQNKTNCLARWPHVLQIQTVAMDETTSIGVIELKTCIQAIVQCSPELVARLGQDYTVYAYDYSEYDNPLVGQGMLSWALAAASPTPSAPAHQSRQLITGRVCKNIPGIFSNGIKETLEVKLRLVPVPTVLQSEYISNMEKYREISKVIPPGLDINEWNSFLQSNPNIAQMASKISAPTPPTSNQRDGVSMEVINQLLSPSLQQQAIMEPFNQSQNQENASNDSPAGSQSQKNSRPSSRASVKRPYKRRQKTNAMNGGNTSGYEEGTDAEERLVSKRRGKKNASADEEGTDVEERPAAKKRAKKNGNGDYGPEGTDADDGPGRKKRAKITKADWTSKDTIGSTSDSLRVTASTAASIRLFRPIAMSPATGMSSHLQELPRAPTPVPNLPTSDQSRNTAPSQSILRRNSILSQGEPRTHVSPYPILQPSVGTEDQVMDSIESANPSPERNASHFATPPDIGSSPPVMRTASPVQSSPACPSSPELPQMPRTDSGFMSGSLDDLFGEDDESMRLVEAEDVEVVKRTKKRRAPRPTASEVHHGFAIQEETPGPMECLPTKMLKKDVPPVPKLAPKLRADSFVSEDGQTLPTLLPKPTNSATSQSIYTQPESQAVGPPVNESQNSTPQPQQSLTSGVQLTPAPAPASKFDSTSRSLVRTASMGSLTLPTLNTVAASDPGLLPSNLQRCQSWSQTPHPFTEAPMEDSEQAAKNRVTRRRLELAIEKGEMPPFCFNCGAIDTPTWRKVFTKEVKGTPGYYDYSDEPGKVMAIDVLGRDSQGQPNYFRLIKKSLAKGENKLEFKEMTLCNPCGIWIAKYKSQRPEDKFQKDPSAQPKRRKKKMQQNGYAYPASEAYFPQSEGYFPQSEAAHPQFEAPNPPQADGASEITSNMNADQTHQSRAPFEQRRASSVRAPKRLKAMTSDAASAALRRAIQSSPARWMGSQQSPIEVEDEDLGETRRLLFPSPRKDNSPKVLGEVVTNVVTVTIAADFHSPKESTVDMADKENCPPVVDMDVDEDLLKLFEEEMARPTTPFQKTPPQNPFKTPTRPPSNHRPITRSVTRSNRSARTVKSPEGIILIQKTPTRTPGSVRRSPRNHHAVFESPFTATLNQLMSDANNNSFSPSRQYNAELDFSSLPLLDGTQSNSMSFSHLPAFDSDFFSTDVPMPSSPPRMFSLYEDPHSMGSMDWNMNFEGDEGVDFTHGEGDEVVLVKTEPDLEENANDVEASNKKQA